TNRDGVELGVEGACGFGKSPNPTGDAFFDASLDNNTRGFNVPHAMFEIEVPLTKNADGEPRPNGGVYDPSPAFWSAAAPGSGTLVLSQNMVSILIGADASGTSTVSPLPFTLARKRGTLTLNPEPDEDKIALHGSFSPPAGPAINPPVDGLTVTLSDADGVLAHVAIPPGSQGWKTLEGPKWVFTDKKDGTLG